MTAKFSLGQIVITPAALEQLSETEVRAALDRHAAGDWGEVSTEDRSDNEYSLACGFRLQSAYHAGDGTKFWVMTEGDRSATTVMLPDDY